MPETDKKKTLSGHTVEPMSGEEAEKYLPLWKGYSSGCIRLQPGGTLMTTPFTLFHDRIMNFKFRSDDVVVMTYPKCGTTWMQEVVWTMRNSPDLENPMAAAPVNMRVPFMELDSLVISDNMPVPGPDHPLMQTFSKMCPGGSPADGVFIQIAENTPAPRTVKTHLPFSLLPPNILDTAKVVYVYRNPKDMVVSYLHHCRLMRNHDFVGNLEQFVDTFVEGDLLYGHYDRHLKEAFSRQSKGNLLLVRFEDLKFDTAKELKRLDTFLGTDLNDEQLQKVAKYTSFEEMKKRDNVVGGDPNEEGGMFNTSVIKEDGGFFRKGTPGNFKEVLSKDLIEKVDAWTEQKLADSDVTFRYSSKPV